MKKLITNTLLLLAIISIASAASVSTNTANYEVGDAIDITVSDCAAGSTVTLNIQGFWADQGTSDSSNEYTSSYTIPAGFNSGTYTLNANCAGTPISANFCVNPGCSTGETEDSGSDSGSGSDGGSSSGDTGGSSGGSEGLVTADSDDSVSTESSTSGAGSGYSSTTESTPEKVTSDSSSSGTEEKQDDERGSSLGIIITLLIIALIIGGGFFLWKKYRKPAGYVAMPQNPTQ